MTVRVRQVEVEDADEQAALLVANRAFLEPWEPSHTDAWYTAEHQRERLAEVLARHADGLEHPELIMVDHQMVGRVNLNNMQGRVLLRRPRLLIGKQVTVKRWWPPLGSGSEGNSVAERLELADVLLRRLREHALIRP